MSDHNSNQEIQNLQESIRLFHPKIEAMRGEMAKIIVGQHVLIHRLLVGLLAKGHILLEGVPGLAKTTAIVTLARICDADFHRIQFTPDLLPSDLIGNRVFDMKKQDFFVRKGPLFAHFVLADEINRSPAKVQSALLEAMQEYQVTIGEETFPLPKPFFVLATQNPIEQEGTFPLPEAQVDRFLLKTVLSYPTNEEEQEVLNRVHTQEKQDIHSVLTLEDIQTMQSLVRSVFVDKSIKKYITDIIGATRDPEKFGMKDLKEMIAYGASPRGSINLMKSAQAVAFLEGRAYVIPEDIKSIALDILRHRIMPHYEAQAEGITAEDLVKRILEHVPVP